MEGTFDSAAVKARVLDQVGREARWYRYRLPILLGTLGALALFALYLFIVTIAQGWQHAVELFWQDRWVVFPIILGFGVQAGLYTVLKMRLFVPVASTGPSGPMMGVGGTTSTLAMVACCAHHVTDVLPILGLTAAATFLAEYRTVFMLVGLGTTLVGIAVMLVILVKERRKAVLMISTSPILENL